MKKQKCGDRQSSVLENIITNMKVGEKTRCAELAFHLENQRFHSMSYIAMILKTNFLHNLVKLRWDKVPASISKN